MKNILTLILIFALSSVYCYSQNANELDNIYTPLNSDIFGGENSGNYNSNFKGNQVKNIITTPVGTFLRANYLIIYERAATERLSFSCSVGRYFGFDVLGSVFMEGFSDGLNHFKNLYDPNVVNLSEGKNFIVGFGIRNYLGHNFNKRIFFELNVKYASYQLKYIGTSNNSFSFPDNTIFNVKQTSFLTTFNAQFSRGNTMKLCNELYCGFGIRTNVFDDYYFVNKSTVPYKYNLTGGTSTEYNLMIVVGYRLGVGW